MAEHSPTPWWRDDDGFIASGSGDTYTTVADVNVSARNIDDREADCELIIRAVNSHRNLVEALKAAHEMLCEWRNSMEEPSPDEFCRVDLLARRTLAESTK